MDPWGAMAGSVGPRRLRTDLTQSGPFSARAMRGVDCMKLTISGKNGLSAKWE